MSKRCAALVSMVVLAACGTSGTDPIAPPPVEPGPSLSSVSPTHGTFGTRVVLVAGGLGADPSLLTVTFTGAAQGAMRAPIVESTAGSLTVLVPGAVAEATRVTVSLSGRSSTAIPFAIDPLVDPTPAAPGAEAAAVVNEIDGLVANLGSILDGMLAPQLEGTGQAAAAASLRSGVARLRASYAPAVQARLAARTPAELATLDALLSTPEWLEARSALVASSAALATTPPWRDGRTAALLGMGGFDGGTVKSIQQVRVFLVKAKATMEKLDTALLVAMVASGAASAIPGFQSAAALIAVLEEIRESVVKPIIAILDRVIPLMDTFPTRAVGRTLVVTVADNDLKLDQGFGSMTDPVSALHGVGAILVLEPYAVTGTISFGNDGGKALRSAGADLAPDLSTVAEALFELADFDVGNIQVDEVQIRLRLLSSDVRIVPETSGEFLRIQAIAPGAVDLVVQGDLDGVADDCPPVGNLSTCIPADSIRIARSFHAISGDQVAAPATLGPRLDAAQVDGRPPATAHLGDVMVVTGEGFTRDATLAHQDVHFVPAPGYPESGVAWSIHQSLNDYGSFRSEVTDALPGPMTVWVQGHASNAIDFTILPPRLDAVPPSGIAGEFWRITGEGFSGTPAHNEADWNGFRSLPERGSHRQLELTVPDQGRSGPFRIVTLGQLLSDPYDVQVRRFSPPAMLSAPGRFGLRPAVAVDASDGRRLVAWVDRTAKGAAQLVASVLPGQAAQAGTPVVLSATLGGHPAVPARPAVAAAGGRVHVAWVDRSPQAGSEDRVVLSTSTDGVTWSQPVTLSAANGPARQPAIAADGSRVVVAWIEEGTVSGAESRIRYRISENGGLTFGETWQSQSPDASDPALAVKGNAVVVAWSAAESTGRGIVAVRSEDGGLNFQPPWRFGAVGQGAVARRPAVAVGPSCVQDAIASVYLAWEQVGAADLAEDVLFARVDGTVATQQNVTRSGAHSQVPQIVVDADCIPALAWIELGHPAATLRAQSQGTGTGAAIPATVRFARSFDGGVTFNERPMTLGRLTDGSRIGHLSMAGGGQALLSVAWQEDFGPSPVVAFRTTDGEGAAPAAQPAAPAGEVSADLVYRNDGPDLWVSAPDGTTRLLRVTRGLGTLTAPAPSPDGRFLAFQPAPDNVVVAEADGAHPVRIVLAADFLVTGNLHWSPRGDHLAVGAPMHASWVMADSRGFRLMGTAGVPAGVLGTVGAAPWSPDGHLAFGTTGAWGNLDPASNAVSPFRALAQGTNPAFPAWSPDGGRIAFVATATPPEAFPAGTPVTGNVHVQDQSTGFTTQLGSGGFDALPVWSPDGTAVAWMRGGPGHRQVHVQRTDRGPGSDVNLTANLLGLEDLDPVFLPDGSAVVVRRLDLATNAVRTVSIDRATLAVRELTTLHGGSPAVQHMGQRPVWAPDAAATVGSTATTSASVSWAGASDDVGVDHYEIWIGDIRVVANVPGGSTSWTVTGLSPGTAYTFTVRACDAAGNCSLTGPSAGATTSTQATAPTWSANPPELNHGMPWSPGSGYDGPYSVAVHWTPAAEAAGLGYGDPPTIEYRFYVDGSPDPVRAIGAPSTDGTVTPVVPGVEHVITMQACFVGGACTTDGPSLTVTTMPDLSPPPLGMGIESVAADGTRLTIEFGEPLDPGSVPAPGDFLVQARLGGVPSSVVVNAVTFPAPASNGGSDYLSTARTVVELTLASPLAAGDDATVGYAPGANPIRNLGGIPADPFSDRRVWVSSTAEFRATAGLPGGDLVVAGTVLGSARLGAHVVTSAGSIDAFVARRSAAGTWLWVKLLGGSGSDLPTSVASDAAGNVLVAGSFEGSIAVPGPSGPLNLVPEGPGDAFVAKMDGNGNWLWATRVGGTADPGQGAPESAASVAVDPQGNVYAAGGFRGTVSFGGTNLSLASAGDTDVWVARLSPAGAWQWAVRAGGASGIDSPGAVAADGTSVFVTGTFTTSMTFPGLPDPLLNSGWGFFLARLTADGAFAWATDASLLGGGGQALVPDGAGGVLVAGHASVISMSGSTPTPWVARYGVGGTQAWAATATTEGIATSLAMDGSGRLHAAGWFRGAMTVGAQTISAGPYRDVFLGRISLADGSWTRAMSSGSNLWTFLTPGGLAPCGTASLCLVGSVANNHPLFPEFSFGTLTHPASNTQGFVATAGDAGAPPQLEWTALQGMENAPP